MMAPEVHHAVPRCLLKLHEAASETLPDRDLSPAWLEWEDEAGRWKVPVEIARGELEALVNASEVVLERERHRILHVSDFARWGRRGGLTTLRRYGTEHFSMLALRRWGRISASDLDAARVLR